MPIGPDWRPIGADWARAGARITRGHHVRPAAAALCRGAPSVGPIRREVTVIHEVLDQFLSSGKRGCDGRTLPVSALGLPYLIPSRFVAFPWAIISRIGRPPPIIQPISQAARVQFTIAGPDAVEICQPIREGVVEVQVTHGLQKTRIGRRSSCWMLPIRRHSSDFSFHRVAVYRSGQR